MISLSPWVRMAVSFSSALVATTVLLYPFVAWSFDSRLEKLERVPVTTTTSVTPGGSLSGFVCAPSSTTGVTCTPVTKP